MSTFRPSTLSPTDSGSIRQSPFRRQNSHSPAPNFQRESTPTSSPTKASHLSPTRPSSLSLSPEKASPFVRRPSQNSQGSTSRPVSPFARPASGLNAPPSPSAVREASIRSGSDESAETSGEAPASPSAPRPSQANLRPTAHRTITSSTTSTIRQPIFNTAPPASKALGSPYTPSPRPSNPPTTFRAPAQAMGFGTAPRTGGASYTTLPAPLLHALRSSYEVLDTTSTNTLTPSTLTATLAQVGLPEDPSPYFPPGASQSLTLASYLESLSAPFAQLSNQEELLAAFGAFDRDDSGQVDMGELAKALVSTGPEGGEEDYRLNEREVERVTGEFVARRAFGGKVGGGRGEVFRYREFVGRLNGGGGGGGEMEGVAV